MYYIVKNNSGESVVLTQGSGGNVTVADGKSAIVYSDGAGAGAAVVDITSTFNFQAASAALTAIADSCCYRRQYNCRQRFNMGS
jgi:hypothetical protein